MKIFALVICEKRISKSRIICATYDLSGFGFFQRKSVQEFMNFTSCLLTDKCETTNRITVKEQGFLLLELDMLSGVCVTDQEYPSTAAFNMLNKVLIEFTNIYDEAKWKNRDEQLEFVSLTNYFTRYQNPSEADLLTKVQNELEETKVIVVLNRGEKLDDLVARSEGLSAQSKLFYTTARKANSCCKM